MFPFGWLAAQPNDCEAFIRKVVSSEPNTISLDNKRQLVSCIFQVQNTGFLQDEHACEYDSAKHNIELALAGWNYLNDTLQQANLLKYLGYLHGRLKEFEVAKRQIDRAMLLYNSQDADYGIAVATYDLARVYEFQGAPDSASMLARMALRYWQYHPDQSRIFGLQTYLIYLQLTFGQQHDIRELITANETILSREDVYWQNEMDFYYVLASRYEKLDSRLAAEYQKRYEELIATHSQETSQQQYSMYDPANCH